MHWQDLERSKNIEVDCLGLRTSDVETGLRCLAEVNDLRRSVVDRGTDESGKRWLGNKFDQAVNDFRRTPLDVGNELSAAGVLSDLKLQYSSDEVRMQARVGQFKRENRDLFQK